MAYVSQAVSIIQCDYSQAQANHLEYHLDFSSQLNNSTDDISS